MKETPLSLLLWIQSHLINFQFLTTMKTSFFCMRSCTSLPVEGVLDLEKPGTSAGAAESEWPSMWTSVLPVALISPLLTAENQYCSTVKKRAHQIWENNQTQKLLTYSWVGKLPPILVAWDTIQWLYYWETLRLAIYILRPASVVNIGNRHKIGHCFIMSCMPNVLNVQF